MPRELEHRLSSSALTLAAKNLRASVTGGSRYYKG
ncbi:predicted protein [Sclerotinia sclerotiorum 1980 UF-70]|uniref:Uncharacterized protein n=1 Tax=Sclerotinia sclerotiorum (strain ATCC 18683 / 1980 / Ss-1) TaxID=665079 RepID=A7EFW0_SCLS1|nr:predicted protein [Sclerotinia sclerotiorum 1980 UF-70]EDO01726.1 predicted protein [Sclerotinia sclerotiorum 1980 UF-70]